MDVGSRRIEHARSFLVHHRGQMMDLALVRSDQVRLTASRML